MLMPQCHSAVLSANGQPPLRVRHHPVIRAESTAHISFTNRAGVFLSLALHVVAVHEEPLVSPLAGSAECAWYVLLCALFPLRDGGTQGCYQIYQSCRSSDNLCARQKPTGAPLVRIRILYAGRNITTYVELSIKAPSTAFYSSGHQLFAIYSTKTGE
jgi:hypothetical protein